MAVLTGSFLSTELGRHNSFSVIMPHDILEENQWGFPVLYLLHGRADDANTWLYRSNIERYAQERGICVVMPDIANSYCTDMAYGGSYYTYVARELPEVMGAMFRMSVRREDTFIGGVSMGGYGALKCVLSSPEHYGGCIALSPIADISHVMAQQCSEGNRDMWRTIVGNDLRANKCMDLFQLVEESGGYVNMCPKIYMACGKQDPYFDDCVRLKDALDAHRVEYTFEQAAAGHEWSFWDVAIQRGLDAMLAGRQ